MSLSVFAEINNSLREKVAKSGRAHDQHRAVFIAWESACARSQHLDPDAKGFASLLEDSFGFRRKEILISPHDPFESLKNQLAAVADPEQFPPCLWMIYYAGNAVAERGRLFWTSPSSETSRLDVFTVLGAIAGATFDAVLVADCDYGVIPSIPYSLTRELQEATKATASDSVPTLHDRVLEALFAPSGAPPGSPSFTGELCRVLGALKEDRVNIMGLRSKLVCVSSQGESYAPHYIKLVPSAQSNLLEKVGSPTDLRVALRQPLDHGVLGQLKEWALRKPNQIKRLVFAECEREVGWKSVTKERPATVSEFTLSVSTDSPGLLDHPDWHAWIGSAPNAIDTPRYNIHSAFTNRRLSKSAGDEEVEMQLEALVKRRNHEESWRNHDSRFGHYNRVIVLPLIWEVTGFAPELLVLEDLELLANTFKDEFGFTVEETFKIPAGRAVDISSQDTLENKIRDLVDQGRGPDVLGAGDLLIVIYSGHGSNTVHSTGRAIWSSGALPSSGLSVRRETVDWSHLELHLDAAECDVAQVLDCCYAASAAKAPEDRGRNEILAACVRENRTAAGPNCFSRIVATAVKRLAGEGDPFTFRELAERVDLETRRRNRSGTMDTIPSPFYKQISHHMSSIMLRPRSANLFTGTRRPAVLDALDRKVVAKVFVVLSLNSQLEEVRREHITKRKLLEALQSAVL